MYMPGAVFCDEHMISLKTRSTFSSVLATDASVSQGCLSLDARALTVQVFRRFHLGVLDLQAAQLTL